jgi:transcriptional regulator with XRE-family HTH domain
MSRKKIPYGNFFEMAERIKKIRGDMSKKKFAEALGISAVNLLRYEAGRKLPLDIAKKIADFGGVDIEWLLLGDASAPAPQLREAAPEALAARPRPLNEAALADIIFRVRDFANRRRLSLDLATEARLISSLYIGIYEADLRLPDDREIEANLEIVRRDHTIP